MTDSKDKSVSSLLRQLEGDEAILLMYLAGELSADDRAEVDRRLAADAGLRAGLDRLREAHGWMTETLRQADAATKPAIPEAVAVRRVGQAVRQWHAARLARPAAAPAGGGSSATFRRRWLYPVAAAATVALAFLGYWAYRPPPDGVVLLPAEDMPRPRPQPVAEDERPDAPPAYAFTATDPFAAAYGGGAVEPEWMTEAERRLAALVPLPEDVADGIFPNAYADASAVGQEAIQ